MSILLKPLCAVLGHRRSRRRVWHDDVDLRALCVRCGTPLIRSIDKGWRAFGPDDAHPDRISRDAYREQMKRETELRAASPQDLDQWARLLVAAFGTAEHLSASNPASLFDRMAAALVSDAAFAEAAATARLDLPARAAVGIVCGQMIGAARPIPGQFADPLARYLLARVQSTSGVVLPMAMFGQD